MRSSGSPSSCGRDRRARCPPPAVARSSDSEDARRVAAQLDIPYYVLDYTTHFRQGVVDRFMADYRHGRTPNPCVECNRTVKFARLLEQSVAFGCDFLVTGHYARVRSGVPPELWRGIDREKDQSYVLSMLGPEELARVRLPIGEMTKAETQAIAAGLGLRTAAKPTARTSASSELGIIETFSAATTPITVGPGPVIDDGEIVGEHDGVAGFTIGQRHGLGVAVGQRRYVVEIRAQDGAVVLGSRGELQVDELTLDQVTWTGPTLRSGDDFEVQFRSHGQAVPARWDNAAVMFASSQFGIATGQTAAFYAGERVLGSGVIAATKRAA